MNKILFDAKIHNLYSPDYGYLQDTFEEELKKLYRQIIQNPGVPAIIKGFNLMASTTYPGSAKIYHAGNYGGLISENGDIVETTNILDNIAPSDSTVGVENFVYIRLYKETGTFNKSTEEIEIGVSRNIDIYDYTRFSDREVDKWEVKVYTQDEVLAMTQDELDELVCLGSFIANGSNVVTEITNNGRVLVRAFIQNGSIQTDMIASESFLLPQENVEESQTIDDAYTGSPANLEEDLNQIRTILKQVKGTYTWDEYITNSLLDQDSSVNRLHGNGVISGEWDEMEVIANSTGISVVVKSGKALVEGDVSHVLPSQTLVLELEDPEVFTVGDWNQRQGEIHVVPSIPSTVTLDHQNVGNLKITDKFGEPYPNGFREGIDYTVNYITGVITIPPTIESRIALEEIHCYYDYGFDRYDLVEVGEDNTIQIKTGTPSSQPKPPTPTERFVPLAQIKINPFYTSLPASDIIDNRSYTQYVRNLRDIPCTDVITQEGTVEKFVYYTSSGEVDSTYDQWSLTTHRNKNVAITSTGGTRIRTIISCLDNDELWLMVDKTPWANDITVEFDMIAGYQELGLNINPSSPSGLRNDTDYYFKLNNSDYKVTTGETGIITYSNTATLIDDATRPVGFYTYIINGDIRVEDLFYIGLDSIVDLAHTDVLTGDLFQNMTGFTAFDTAVTGTDTPATSGYQELGLEFSDENDDSGLSTMTCYFFKVNGASYKIKTSTGTTWQHIADLMDDELDSAGFTASVVSNIFPVTGKDIKITNDTTGSSSTVTLEFDNANLFTHITGYTAVEIAQDEEISVSEYHDIDLSSKDRIEYYPVLVTKGLSKGYHSIRITVDNIRDFFVFYSALIGKMGIYYSHNQLYGQIETEPYKVTHFRENYTKLYVDPLDDTKANLFLENNKEICSSTGRSLNYWSVEQKYPVSRIDDYLDSGPSNTYDITDYSVALQVIGENPSIDSMVFFTPGVDTIGGENHQRVGFYIENVGAPTDFDSLDVIIHNSNHEQQGVWATKDPNDVVKDAWNYWEIPITLNKGETYHYHILMVDRTGIKGTVRSATAVSGINFLEMYKPYTGLFEDANTVIFTSTGGSLVNERTVGEDTPNARHDAGILDIMGVDLSNDTVWDNWEYEEYIGVDVVTGRVKFPPGYSAEDYWVRFNMKDRTTEIDAKSILRHGESVSIEDDLRQMQTDAILHMMGSDSTIPVGDLAFMDTSTGQLTKFSLGDTSHFYSVVGICHSIPEVNKIGKPNPINICLKGAVKLTMINTSGWSVGDSVFLKGSTGTLVDQSSVSGLNWYETKRLGIITSIETNTYLELFVDSL